MKTKLSFFGSTLIILMVFVYGCAGISNDTHNLALEQTEEIIQATSIELQPTNTIIDQVQISTLVEEKFITPTPRNTLMPEDAIEQLEKFTPEDCVLPCVWGIIPGNTTFSIFEDKYLQLGDFEYVPKNDEGKFYLGISASQSHDEFGYVIATDFSTVNEVLVGTNNLRLTEPIDWSVALSHLGQPEGIFLDVDKSAMPNYHYYFLLISYQQQGVNFVLKGNSYIVDEVTTRICPLSEEFLSLSLDNFFLIFDPDKSQGYFESLLVDTEDWELLQTFDSFNASISTIEFYERYLVNHEDNCFEVKMDYDF